LEHVAPTPTHSPSMPQSGWWKCPQSLATDPVFLRIEDEQRIASVAVYVASLGWCLTHNSSEGWVPSAAVSYGQVLAGPRDQLNAAAEALVGAGLFAIAEVNGMSGYVVAGAAHAVAERYKRQASAAEAGRASQASQSANRSPSTYRRPSKPNPDAPVDWSQVSTDL
jgi:hypothetical protein